MYKRGINDLENFKNISYYLSSNRKTYSYLGYVLDIKKPYNGIYINNNKIYVSNIAEKIELGSKTYKIANINTISSDISSDMYLSEINLDKNYFRYNCDDIEYVKTINFIDNTDILCIEYDIKSEAKHKAMFKVIPFLTYRNILSMKKSITLKFNKRNIDSGILVNLSVSNNENVVIKSDYATFKESENYINNVKHEYIDKDLTKELFNEDLYIPGEYIIKIKPGAEVTFRIYISYKDFDISNYINKPLSELVIDKKDDIKMEYIELKKLKLAIESFDLDYMASSLPNEINIENDIYNLNNIDKVILNLIDITKAIEGQYLIFKKYDLAIERLEKIILYTNSIDLKNTEYMKLKLWLIEVINKLWQKNKCITPVIKEFIKTTITNIHKDIVDKDCEYLKYIEVISLTYNAFKIYENILEEFDFHEISKYLKDEIIINFWDDQSKVLKYDLKEKKIYATPEMVYTISLSYQIIESDMTIKLLDTIFKELYTPYGLREISKHSLNYNGIIYPKYMAHFVKANLKQNGVTYASQKISYNLVKELLLEIGKYIPNTVKSIYHEKGINVDSVGIDLLTTAEMIRLYDMLM